MPPSGYATRGSSYVRGSRTPGRLTGSSLTAPRRPTDLNDPSFADRFVSDLGTIFTNAPRALLNLVGAPVSDVAALLPGGRAAGTAGQATLGLGGDILGSLGNTGGLLLSAPLAIVNEDARDRLGEYREEFFANPGLFSAEHIGNVAIAGAAAGKTAGAAARVSAGQAARGTAARTAARQVAADAGRGPMGQLLAGSNARRVANAEQLADIAAGGGPGAFAARTARFTDDILGHPYRAAGRKIVDARLPGRASAREVTQQVRSAVPLDRLTVTEDMKGAADLRRLRADVDAAREAGDGPALEGALEALDDFERSNAPSLDRLENLRLTGVPVDELPSPLARDIRRVLDTESVQGLTKPLVEMNRWTKGRVQRLREDKGEAGMDILAERDPRARRTMAVRNLRDLDRQVDLREYGIEMPTWARSEKLDLDLPKSTNDADLLDILLKVADNDDVRSKLPNLESTLELTILDLAEQSQGLPDGALRNQLYDDATLTPEVANVVRALQREGAGSLDDATSSAFDSLADLAGTEPGMRMGRDASAAPITRFDSPDDLRAAARENAANLPDETRQWLTDDGRYAYHGTGSAVDGFDGGGLANSWDRAATWAARGADGEILVFDKGSLPDGVRRTLDDADIENTGEFLTAGGVAGLEPVARIPVRDLLPPETPTGVLDRLPAGVRGVVDRALGQAYRIPDEQLANPISGQSPQVQATYARALERLTREAAERDVDLANLDLGDPDRWAMRVVKDADGGYRAMEPGENPTLGIAPSSKQGKALRKAGLQVKAARSRLDKISDQAEKGRWAERGGVFDSYRTLKRQTTQLSRTLKGADVRSPAGMRTLDELGTLVGRVEEVLTDAGFKLDDVQAGKYDDLMQAAEQGERTRITQAARSLDDAGRAFESRLAKAQGRATERVRRLEQASRDFDRVQSAFDDAGTAMRNSIDAAPAVARPILQVGRALQDVDQALRDANLGGLADELRLTEIPQTLDDLAAAGVSPTFLRRIEERAAAVGYRASAEQPVKTPTMSAQRRREMTDIEVTRDIDRVKSQQDIELTTRTLNGQMVEDFLGRFGRSKDQIAESLIEAGKLDRDAWRDMTNGQRERVLQEAGFNAYVPDQIFSFKVRRTGDGDQWIPTYLNQSLVEYMKQGPVEKLIAQVLNPATTTWKNFILALRPAWHVYNVVGGAVLGAVGGGVNPAGYLEFMRPGGEARELLRQHRLGWDLEQYGLTGTQADALFGGGTSRDLAPNQRDRARLSDGLRETESVKRVLDNRYGEQATGTLARAKGGFDRLVGSSYRANAYMDNLNRASLYLYETTLKNTDVESALARVNTVLGDYQSMTPFEKTYVKSVFPFYAWMRHITKLTANMLGPDNITRTAILGSVTQTLGQPDELEATLPSYMAGDIRIGETESFLGMRGFNPWQDVLDIFTYNDQISSRGSLRSMHPLLQLGAERATGVDTLTGRPFSRPIPVLDDLGREVPTAPPLLTHLRQKVAPPQLDLGIDLLRSATGRPTARYDTGEPMVFDGARERSVLSGLGSFVGVPVRQVDTEGLGERRREAMDRAAQRIAAYREDLEEHARERERRTLGQRLLPFGG